MEKKESTQVKECKTCKKGLSKPQIGIVIFSMYVLASAVYGTYKILEQVSNMF